MIQIPRHFDQIRGSIICAKHGPIRIDLHFTPINQGGGAQNEMAALDVEAFPQTRLVVEKISFEIRPRG